MNDSHAIFIYAPGGGDFSSAVTNVNMIKLDANTKVTCINHPRCHQNKDEDVKGLSVHSECCGYDSSSFDSNYIRYRYDAYNIIFFSLYFLVLSGL